MTYHAPESISPTWIRLAALACCSITTLPVACLAQPAPQTPGWKQQVTGGAIYQAAADIDGGGEFDVARYAVAADFTRTIDRQSSLGFGFAAATDDYGFSGIGAPWGRLTRFEASCSYSKMLSQDWMLRISPSVQTYYESGASASDAIVAGLIGAATHTFSPELSLGLGAAVFSGLEETRVFPFLAIRWKISETWSMQNPFRPGPAGPAGLEISRKGEAWELAFGGAYRTYRFKLSEDAAVADGIGEYNGVPLFVRATRKLNETWELDLYAGLVVAGSLELEDEDGRDLVDRDFDPAPLAAVTFTGRF